MRADAQPTSGAFEIGVDEQDDRADVIVTAPSGVVPAHAPRRAGSRARIAVRAMTTTPTGMLTKKIHSQPAYFVSTPPRSTPIAAPLPPIAPQMPSALFRSSAFRERRCVTIDERGRRDDRARRCPAPPRADDQQGVG